jgi:hypothetical protein
MSKLAGKVAVVTGASKGIGTKSLQGNVENAWLFLEPIGLRQYKCRHLFSRDKAAKNELTVEI